MPSFQSTTTAEEVASVFSSRIQGKNGDCRIGAIRGHRPKTSQSSSQARPSTESASKPPG
jgi:hypothetical protein